MSDLPVRDRVQAILTLADAAEKAPEGLWSPDYHRLLAVLPGETPWLAHMLLEALDTIDNLTTRLEVSENVAAHFADRANELEGVALQLEVALEAIDRSEGERTASQADGFDVLLQNLADEARLRLLNTPDHLLGPVGRDQKRVLLAEAAAIVEGLGQKFDAASDVLWEAAENAGWKVLPRAVSDD